MVAGAPGTGIKTISSRDILLHAVTDCLARAKQAIPSRLLVCRATRSTLAIAVSMAIATTADAIVSTEPIAGVLPYKATAALGGTIPSTMVAQLVPAARAVRL